ncbi:MAG: HK97 family phage prohead protease [Saccharofermentanales bacterium]
MPIKSNRQYRDFLISLETSKKLIDTEYYVEGYASTFEPYVLFEDFDGDLVYERFEPDAFNQTDLSDVIFQYNHEGRVYARNSNESLIVEVNNIGLFIAADLGLTEGSRQIYEDIKTRLCNKMSFGFMPGEYVFDKKTKTIVHKSVKKVFDVSAVSIPANSNTEIQARSFVDGVIKQVQQEFAEKEQERQRLLLLLTLGD